MASLEQKLELVQTYHLVLFVNEQQARDWDDAEVVKRWTALFPRNAALVSTLQKNKSSKAAQKRLQQQKRRKRHKHLRLPKPRNKRLNVHDKLFQPSAPLSLKVRWAQIESYRRSTQKLLELHFKYFLECKNLSNTSLD